MSVLDSNSDLYYMALTLLHILRNEDGYSDTARLALILDEDNFDRLIDNCGGMTITIPTREEVNRALKSLVYYQLTKLHRTPTREALKLSGVSLADAAKVQSMGRRINRFFKSINPKLIAIMTDKDEEVWRRSKNKKPHKD